MYRHCGELLVKDDEHQSGDAAPYSPQCRIFEIEFGLPLVFGYVYLTRNYDALPSLAGQNLILAYTTILTEPKMSDNVGQRYRK